MVKRKGTEKRAVKQGGKGKTIEKPARIVQITAETGYSECSEKLTEFGGLLALVKFLDLLLALFAFADNCTIRIDPAFERGVARESMEKCGYHLRQVTVNIDTTVGAVYGEIEGARKWHNTKHRGKKGLRPVLCFLAETREYLRRG